LVLTHESFNQSSGDENRDEDGDETFCDFLGGDALGCYLFMLFLVQFKDEHSIQLQL